MDPCTRTNAGRDFRILAHASKVGDWLRGASTLRDRYSQPERARTQCGRSAISNAGLRQRPQLFTSATCQAKSDCVVAAFAADRHLWERRLKSAADRRKTAEDGGRSKVQHR